MPLSWGRVAKIMVSPVRHPRTGMFYFRRAVPKALRLQVGVVLGRPGVPAWELKRTLGTHDISEAKTRMPEALAWADSILEAARNGARPLTHREIHALAGLWYQRRLCEWEANPEAAHDWDHWGEGLPTDPYVEGTENDDEPVKSKQGAREWKLFLATLMPEVNELLSSNGVVTDDASKEQLAELIVTRLPEALATHWRRRTGDYSPDTLPATFPAWESPASSAGAPEAPAKQAAVSLKGLFKAWTLIAVQKPRTIKETDYAIQGLVKFLGHDDAAKAASDDLTRWRDLMKSEGLTNNTWNNRLSMIAQVFGHGVAERILKTNPTDGLRVRRNKVTSPKPYDDAEAARILLAARHETRVSLRWAHWVMAFSGMRVAEALQLTGQDIRSEGGIWFMDVNEDDPTASVKTGNRRNVPLHPALIKEGFLAYAQTVKGNAPLFPDKKVDAFGNRGGRGWQVTGRWVREKVKITDKTKAPNHSWRHRIEDELRAADVAEDARDAITGHARQTTGRQYGVRGESLARLHRELSKVPVPRGVVPGEIT